MIVLARQRLNVRFGLVFMPVLFLLAVISSFPTGEAMAQAAFEDPRARGATGGAAGADLTPVEARIDGGQVSVGATAQVVLLFRNDSGRPLQTGAIQLYPSSTVSATVALNQCSQEVLPAGAVCAVSVSVKGLQPGNWRVEMLMRHSGRTRLVTATLSGTVTAGDAGQQQFVSDIEAIPTELDFGDLESSQPVIRGIVLRNITSEPIDINAIYIEASQQSGYSLRSDCSSLSPGQACIVTITWSPVLEGQASGVLLVEHTGPTTVASVKLDGEFRPDDVEEATVFPRPVPGKGLIVASQEEINFGTIGTTSAITVSLVNIGDAPVKISDITMGGSDNGVSLGKRGCTPDLILQPVEACPLTLTWSPVRAGAILDDVQVVHDGARGVLVIPVRGSSTGVISQDTKAVRLAEDGALSLEASPTKVTGTGSVSATGGKQGKADDSDLVFSRDDSVDAASVLDGFVVTSHSPKRSIISGPGGSRIVYNGEQIVIGGFLWNINIRTSGVEFRSGKDKVLLLFDRSLSSVNRVSGQSGLLGAGTAATPAAAAPSAVAGTN